jgi:predicted small lipoprotein YifL
MQAGEGAAPLLGAHRIHPDRAPLQTVFLFAALLAPLFSLTSCGIESVPYYYPPNANTASLSATTLTFFHNTSNNTSDFKGYELYYRCYADPTKAEYDRQQIEALAASTSSAPDSVLYSMINLYKFSRMYDSLSIGDTPLLWFSNDSYKTSSVTYIVSLNHPAVSVPNWTVQATYGYNSSILITNLYRSATTSTGSHKGFLPTSSNITTADFNTTDSDYDGYSYANGGGSPSTGGPTAVPYSVTGSLPLYMVVFAVGIGLPQDTLNTVPSLPASFGATIQIRP